jgi:hypothetical protein
MLISKIMENYEILNPEKALSWALSQAGSVLTACEPAKEPYIFDWFRCSDAFVDAGARNEPSETWGTNIAVCSQIGQQPELGN